MWEKYLSYLSSEDKSLSKPVEYSLWCHFFEDQELVEDSWESDYFGNIEKEKALELLEQLKLSEDVKHLELLKEKLKQ
ncbi:hypothetical protein N6H14_31075 [Paenibacillus sp. CC-CFT747]|nr:hypothetical protein N6H14_31075 [Paenibacillus sp. CC-CFT747]